MLRFKNYLSEEVLPAAQVKDGSIDLEKPAVRGQINATLASVTAQSAVTPYIVLHKISKALAYFHIIMPKRAYLEGDKGVEVVELKQFGHKMGMTNDGQFVHDVPGRYFLFLSYRVSSSIGGGYGFAGDQLQSLGGSFKVTAKVVDEVELQSLLSAAEISLAENCDAFEKQQKYKAMAPKEPMHTALGDCDCSQGDSPSTKDAVSTSMRKTDKKLSAASLDEERKRSASVADAFASGKKANQRTLRTDGKSVTYHGNTIASHQGDHVHVTAAGYGHSPSTRGHLNSITSRFGGERFSQKKGQLHYGNKPVGSDEVIKIKKSSTVSEDKDPCWKGYEMIGMKKKGGKPVPNCVPVKEEEQIDELKRSTLASYIKKAHVSGLAAADDAANAYHRRDYKELHKQNKTGEKREQGINRAAGKLAKEETLGEEEKKVVFTHKKGPLYGTVTQHGDNRFSTRRKIGMHWKTAMHNTKEGAISHLENDGKKKKLKEDTAVTTGQKKLRVQQKTVVKRALGKEEPKKTILVTRKGDPKAAAGGGVRRISKDAYDPSKYNLASE